MKFMKQCLLFMETICKERDVHLLDFDFLWNMTNSIHIKSIFISLWIYCIFILGLIKDFKNYIVTEVFGWIKLKITKQQKWLALEALTSTVYFYIS